MVKSIKNGGVVIAIVSMFFAGGINARSAGLNPDSLLNDVNILFASIEEIHPDMFANCSRKDFEKELSAIKSGVNGNTRMLDFYVAVNSLAVKLNDGHTHIRFPYAELKHPGVLLFPFPVEASSSDSSVRVTDDYTESGDAIPLNSEILSINGINIKTVVGKMTEQVSGEKTFYKIDRLKYLFTPLLHALYESREFDIEYRFNETVFHKRIRGITYPERYERQSQTNAGAETEPYSATIDSTNNIAIIDFRQFVQLDRFAKFLDSTFTRIKKLNLKNLIIDLRNNGGGNSELGDELFQYISKVPFKQFGETTIKTSKQKKEFYKSMYKTDDTCALGIVTMQSGELIKLRNNDLRFDGNVYVLQSHYTFSSAASFTWAFKHFGMGEIAGEESGGLAVCFGDIIIQKLPYSKFSYTVSHKKFYHYGATDDNIHGTIPDYEVPAASAMNFTIELIQKKSHPRAAGK